MSPKNNIVHFTFITITFLLCCAPIAAQEPEKPWLDDFRGTAIITNNGISLIPSFSLGKPAFMVDLKFFKDRFSFEPDLRFSLEGKPWVMIFWFRYKAVQKEKFTLRLGVHPAINYRTVTINRNGQSEDLIEARRFLAYEIAPNYFLSPNISVGAYYLYGHGLDASAKHNHFLVANSSFKNIAVSERLRLAISPQLYYLKQDDLDGVYTVSFITLSKTEFPWSVSTVFNKAIDTRIAPEDDFIWSVLLNYHF